MTNNTKEILKALNISNKSVYDYLGISPQAFNTYLNSSNPKKHNKAIAEFLKIDENLLTKDNIDDEILQMSEIQNYENTDIDNGIRMVFRGIKSNYRMLMDFIHQLSHEDIDYIEYNIRSNYIDLPVEVIRNVKIYTLGDKIDFRDVINDEGITIKKENIDKVLLRVDMENKKICSIKLINGLIITLNIYLNK